MAAKTFAECQRETVNKTEGQYNLILKVPFDTKTLINLMRNTPRDKKSVTLVDATVVGCVNSRGAEAFHVDIGAYRVELKGGVNLYCSLPQGVSTTAATSAVNMTAEERRKAEEAEAAENAKWCVLKADLLTPSGEVHRECGDRIMRDVFSELLLSGFQYNPPSAPAVLEKHPKLTDAEHNAILDCALDAKMAELEAADAEGSLVE